VVLFDRFKDSVSSEGRGSPLGLGSGNVSMFTWRYQGDKSAVLLHHVEERTLWGIPGCQRIEFCILACP
jgi:hypothetical protein